MMDRETTGVAENSNAAAELVEGAMFSVVPLMHVGAGPGRDAAEQRPAGR
jgi:hypothetical protein